MPTAPPVSAFSPAETWSFNGVALSQPYWNIATMGGARFALPTLRGQNYAVPYRAGQAQRAKFPDQNTLTLAMWIDGANGSPVNSYPPSDQRLAFNNALQQLRQAIFTIGANGSAQGELERQWYITQGGTAKLVAATAMAEFAGSMEPTMNDRFSAAFNVDFLLADPFFYGTLQTVAVTSSGGTITGLGEGVAGIGFPSSVNLFTVEITAACTVTNTTAGVAFTFNPTGSPSYPVTLDILNYTAVDSAGVNWIAGVSHTGARTWMAILNGSNTITNSAGTATFKFNDCYVLGGTVKMSNVYVVATGSSGDNLCITAGSVGAKVKKFDISMSQGGTLDSENWTGALSLNRVTGGNPGSSITPAPLRDGGPVALSSVCTDFTYYTWGATVGSWTYRVGVQFKVKFPKGLYIAPEDELLFTWSQLAGFSGTTYINVWFSE